MTTLKFRINQTTKQKENLIPGKVIEFNVIEKETILGELYFKCEYKGIAYNVRQISEMNESTEEWIAGNCFVYSKDGINNNTYGRIINYFQIH